MSRDVDFTDAESFVADMDADADRIDGGIVRVEIAMQAQNDGVSDVFVRAGFLVEGSRRQLVLNCGEHWKPRGGGGIDNANKAVSELAERINGRGLEMRAGGFV